MISPLRMRKTLNLYLLKEIAFPFGMILFILTFVLLMGKILQLMDLMVNKGVQFSHIAQLILNLLPSFLLFTVPISLLVGIMMALGRLSSDNELAVMKASGVSLHQLAAPVVLAAAACFVATLVMSYFLVPQGNYATKLLVYKVARDNAGLGVKEKIFNDDFKGILIYADRVPIDGNEMMGVLISDTREGQDQQTIIAEKAYLVSEPGVLAVTLRLVNGSTHTVRKDLKNYRKMDFSTYDIKLDPSGSSATGKGIAKSSTDMTAGELTDKMKTPGLPTEEIRELAIELHKKLSVPVSCLIFAFLAIPLGIRKHRTAKSKGFVLGIATVLAYYVLRLIGEALAEGGRIPVLLGVWLPNLLFGGAAAWLFSRSAEEKPWFRAYIPAGARKP